MQDVRNHLVAAMETLGDPEVSKDAIDRARAISELAQTFTNTVKVELDALRIAGRETVIPEVLQKHPALPGAAP